MVDMIAEAIERAGAGALTEEAIAREIRPLFARTLSAGGIYLANHTLGRPLDQMQVDVAEGARLWAEGLRNAWGPWLAEEQAYRASLAALLGLERVDCVLPKVSAGHALRAVLNTLPVGATVVTTAGEFASVAVVLAQYAALGRLRVVVAARDEERGWTAEYLSGVLRREGRVALVVVSQVFFADGQVLDDMAMLASACHEHGAALLVDCYHALGVVPVAMAELGCDYLIGGCYKYLRGGPGAAFLALAPQVLARGVRPLDTGWFAQEAGANAHDAWGERGPVLRAGGDAWLEGTPPVLTYYQARSGLAFTRSAGVEWLRAYSLGQLQYLRGLLAERGIASVGGDTGHGAFLTIAAANAAEVVRRLSEQAIVVDARDGCVRVCPDCLTTREELAAAAQAVAECWRGEVR